MHFSLFNDCLFIFVVLGAVNGSGFVGQIFGFYFVEGAIILLIASIAFSFMR